MKLKKETKRFSCLAIVIAAALVLASVPTSFQAVNNLVSKTTDLAFVADAAGPGYVAGQVICEVSPGVNIFAIARQLGLTVLEDLEDNLFLLGLPRLMSVAQAVALLSITPGVVLAEPNYLVESPEVKQRSMAFVDQRSMAFVDGESPADYFDQYAMQLIQATEAHSIADGGGVTVAVIDTGVDTNHPAFGQVVPGYDFEDNDSNPTEDCCGNAYGHGTMVAGVVAVVAPGATIMPVRAFNENGVGAASNIGKAIRYAARNGAEVINMSFGLAITTSAPIRNAIDFAGQQGVVLIAAAGNDNTSAPQYPASEDDVLAVAATDQNDVKASFSNYGSHINVSAPGVSIYSAYPGGQFAWADGTSFAAPFVSGEAALVLSAGGGDAGQTIRDTAAPISSYSGLLGSGRINALAAVRQ